MCCGNQRQTISNPAPRASAAPVLAGGAAAAVPPRAGRRPHQAVNFEYEGATAMTVVSPLTARSYRFAHPGARVAVDPRDTPWLTFTPHLRRAG